jgi:hypothetical protein
MKLIIIEQECSNCGTKTSVKCYPFVPAKISGPPEHCYPEEGPDFDPDDCPNCNQPFDSDAMIEAASEASQEDREIAAEYKADRLQERIAEQAWKEENL